ASERIFESLGFLPEGRDFRPHITVGRFTKRSAAPAAWNARFTRDLDSPIAETVRELVLFESITRQEGPEYRPVFRATLGG
ncbi:MAG: hypothetical protein KDD44_13415, partial [Bdellovibrionales bacterium]|nr:hypothetical protein [Bdellovibrionales bacterium]